MGYQDCIASVRKAVGEENQLTDKQLEQVFTQLDKHAERIMAAGSALGYENAVRMAADEIATKLKAAAAIEKRNAAINARVRLEAASWVKANWTPDKYGEGMVAYLIGTQRNIAGGRMSVWTSQQERLGKYLGGLTTDLARADLLKVFSSGAVDRDVARALWSLDDPSMKFDGPEEAMAIAKIVRKWQDATRADMNKAGTWVGKTDNYIVRQSHDAIKVKQAGYEAWRDSVMEKLDWAKIESEQLIENRDTWLKQVWSNLSSGVHLTPGASAGFAGGGNLAKKLSQNRVLHFKTADDWFDYNNSFGTGTIRDSVSNAMDHAAKSVGLMRSLGTNPQNNLDLMVRDLAKQLETADPEVRQKFSEARPEIERALKTVDGTIFRPVHAMAARRWAMARKLQDWAKLGGMILSQLSDLPVFASEAKFQGQSFLGGIGKALQGLTEGKAQGEKLRIMSSVGVLYDSFNAQLLANTGGLDSPGGLATKIDKFFFKLNLSEWWNTTMRQSAADMFAHRLHLEKGTDFGNLDPDLARTLGLYGIDEKRWNVMRKAADDLDEQGRGYLTPDALRNLSDEQLAPLIEGEKNQRAFDNMRDELEEQLRSYYVDRIHYAQLSPDAQTQAFLLRGTQPGTVEGELLRMVGQYKSFPTSFVQKVLGREFYGRRGLEQPWGMSEVAGIARLVVMMTAFGYGSMVAKDLVKGRNPRGLQDPGDDSDGLFFVDTPWVNEKTLAAALAQGGGLGIFGDFLFGDMRNRFGGGLLSTIAGPVLGLADDMADLIGRTRSGEDPRAAAARLAIQNTPFLNLFYTRLAFDYFVTWNLMEMLNPGSVARMERKVEKENATTFWLSPSSVVR